MGEVVSFAKARQTDIFSIFDAACPSLPEETNREVVETAVRSVGEVKSDRAAPLRAACITIAVVSIGAMSLLFFINGSDAQRRADLSGNVSVHTEGRPADAGKHYSSDGAFSTNLVVTDEFTMGHSQSDNALWRQTRETWLAEIAKLESHPYYQQVVKEKRLFSLAHPDQPE